MKIEKLIHDFLLEVKFRHSKGTLRYYQSHLGHFKNYCDRSKISDVSEITDELIVDYVSFMKDTNENITINKNIGCLKMMYKTMKLDHPYLMSVQKLKTRSKTFEMIEKEDLQRIRRYIKALPNKVGNNLYYKCMILLLMDSGVRIQELLLIEKRHVNLEQREILLTHTKTNDDRTIYMSDVTAKYIHLLMKRETNHGYVFHNIIKERPGNYNDVIHIMKTLRSIFGLKKLHAHMFRHSMATIWLESGADLTSVMDVLGHKNLETTQRYLHMSKRHTKKTYQDKYNLD
jgi:integrase/recombinase XerC